MMPSVCTHTLKILELKEKVYELQEYEQQLKNQNDLIHSSLHHTSQQAEEEEEEIRMWKQKYEALRMHNDQMTLRLAGAATSSILTNRALSNRHTNSTETLRKHSSKKSLQLEKTLSKGDCRYLNELKQQRRERSQSRGKTYIAKLPDGLIVQILDRRKGFC